MPVPFRVPLLAAAVLSAVAAPAGQGTTFRGTTHTVAIYATVLDRNHRFVTDLDRRDFAVRDNGRPVEIAVFSSDPAPVTMAILLDTSGSMRDKLALVTGAAGALVDRLGPADAAMIGAFGERTIFSRGFTSDHGVLRQFLDTRLHAGGATPLWNAVDLAMVYLKDVPGRRVVTVFTDGFDTTTGEHGVDAVKKRAEAEEVMIYAIGCWDPDSGDQRPDGELRSVAQHTGGGYTELTWSKAGDLPATFTRILDDLRHQYLIGFAPATFDGRVHALDVRVTRPGLTVRARTSYVAPLDGSGRTSSVSTSPATSSPASTRSGAS